MFGDIKYIEMLKYWILLGMGFCNGNANAAVEGFSDSF
jgi:hypothetical protein